MSPRHDIVAAERDTQPSALKLLVAAVALTATAAALGLTAASALESADSAATVESRNAGSYQLRSSARVSGDRGAPWDGSRSIVDA